MGSRAYKIKFPARLSLILLQYPQRPGNDYHHHQQDCHHRQAEYNEACTPNPQLRVEESELEGAFPPGMVDSTR